jgi:hypothetical protein
LGWTDYNTTIKIKVQSVGENNSLNTNGGVDNDCWNKDFKSVPELNKYSPISFYCRRAEIDFKYKIKDEAVKPINPEPEKVVPQRIELLNLVTVTRQSKVKKPPSRCNEANHYENAI